MTNQKLLKVLKPIVHHDYRLRAQGLLPDRWHWADRLAIRLGALNDPDFYTVEDDA